MTREEAIAIIKAIGKHAIETRLTDPGDIVDATVMAVQALVPKPDEVTGLVPCGCGGKALCSDQRFCTFDGEWLWRVECTECRVSTDGYSDADEAKAKWNRAMGRASE